ncbi:MAG: hypothetical protein JXR96_03970 [Deltaproteobacteria bacterium]|nr:hypothetical protein [Deltaproteobacteria bacterium]
MRAKSTSTLAIAACLAGAALLLSCGNFTGKPVCVPMSCAELGKECGSWSDGCGGEVACGGCGMGESCRAGECVGGCVPATCGSMGKQCGTWDDGCGHEIACPDCPDGQKCSAAGRCVDSPLPQDDRVSECGGFESNGGTIFDAPSAYCDAEVLYWIYEAASQTLSLADTRILLNCCGDHGMTVAQVDGVYVVTETDAPEDGWGRCLCMCVYDFVVSVSQIPAETIPIRIFREVTDSESGTVWEGELDLTAGAGAVVIDETDVGLWCTEP